MVQKDRRRTVCISLPLSDLCRLGDLVQAGFGRNRSDVLHELVRAANDLLGPSPMPAEPKPGTREWAAANGLPMPD
jgi:hypothetical protein